MKFERVILPLFTALFLLSLFLGFSSEGDKSNSKNESIKIRSQAFTDTTKYDIGYFYFDLYGINTQSMDSLLNWIDVFEPLNSSVEIKQLIQCCGKHFYRFHDSVLITKVLSYAGGLINPDTKYTSWEDAIKGYDFNSNSFSTEKHLISQIWNEDIILDEIPSHVHDFDWFHRTNVHEYLFNCIKSINYEWDTNSSSYHYVGDIGVAALFNQIVKLESTNDKSAFLISALERLTYFEIFDSTYFNFINLIDSFTLHNSDRSVFSAASNYIILGKIYATYFMDSSPELPLSYFNMAKKSFELIETLPDILKPEKTSIELMITNYWLEMPGYSATNLALRTIGEEFQRISPILSEEFFPEYYAKYAIVSTRYLEDYLSKYRLIDYRTALYSSLSAVVVLDNNPSVDYKIAQNCQNALARLSLMFGLHTESLKWVYNILKTDIVGHQLNLGRLGIFYGQAYNLHNILHKNEDVNELIRSIRSFQEDITFPIQDFLFINSFDAKYWTKEDVERFSRIILDTTNRFGVDFPLPQFALDLVSKNLKDKLEYSASKQASMKKWETAYELLEFGRAIELPNYEEFYFRLATLAGNSFNEVKISDLEKQQKAAQLRLNLLKKELDNLNAEIRSKTRSNEHLRLQRSKLRKDIIESKYELRRNVKTLNHVLDSVGTLDSFNSALKISNRRVRAERQKADSSAANEAIQKELAQIETKKAKRFSNFLMAALSAIAIIVVITFYYYRKSKAQELRALSLANKQEALKQAISQIGHFGVNMLSNLEDDFRELRKDHVELSVTTVQASIFMTKMKEIGIFLRDINENNKKELTSRPFKDEIKMGLKMAKLDFNLSDHQYQKYANVLFRDNSSIEGINTPIYSISNLIFNSFKHDPNHYPQKIGLTVNKHNKYDEISICDTPSSEYKDKSFVIKSGIIYVGKMLDNWNGKIKTNLNVVKKSNTFQIKFNLARHV